MTSHITHHSAACVTDISAFPAQNTRCSIINEDVMSPQALHILPSVFILSPLPFCFSADKHGITKGEESVLLSYCLFIRIEYMFFPCERTHHHDKR